MLTALTLAQISSLHPFLFSCFSGQGKSSVVSLIERFYDPSSGSIELEGVNVKDLNVEWLRSQLGFVGQEPVLFDTTIAENIRFGMPEGATQEDIENAAKQANAHDFIVSFPDGYNTLVGIGGTQVSCSSSSYRCKGFSVCCKLV